MTNNDKNSSGKAAGNSKTGLSGALAALQAVRRAWWKLYGPFDQFSARLLDSLAVTDRKRRISALAIAIAVNIILLTPMSTFARVRIRIPNAPSDTLNVTMVELPRLDLPDLRDPQITPEPEPEPEPEIVEKPEPEPEPEPLPEPEPKPEPAVVEQEAAPEPEPEPEPVEQPTPEPEPVAQPEPEPEVVEEPEPEPEPEPELNLDLETEPQFAPPAEEPEPLIPEPAPNADDEQNLEPPQEEVVEQTPEEEAPEPLVSVEPEQEQEPGLDELVGEEDTQGEDAKGEDDAAADKELLAAAPTEEEAPSEEEKAAEDEQPQNDDMFDEEPSFGGRRFAMPRVQLPLGDAPAAPGSSGVVAIFCPEQFDNEDKAAECAGRREIRSGWTPGSSGENWSRATELLKSARERGQTGPDMDKLVGPAAARRLKDEEQLRKMTDFRRNVPDAGAISQGSNLTNSLEGTRPAIGPDNIQPAWTKRDEGELTEKEIKKLQKEMDEAEKKK